MKKSIAAIAIASLAFASSALGQTTTTTRQLTTSAPVLTAVSPIPMIAKCTVKGTISFAGSHMAVAFDLAKGDKCSNVEVHALYEVPGPTPSGGGFTVPTYKDAGPLAGVKATGDIMTKKCSYIFANSVTVMAGKQIKISGMYKGGLATQANMAGGETAMFSTAAGQTYTKDFTITFTIIT